MTQPYAHEADAPDDAGDLGEWAHDSGGSLDPAGDGHGESADPGHPRAATDAQVSDAQAGHADDSDASSADGGADDGGADDDGADDDGAGIAEVNGEEGVGELAAGAEIDAPSDDHTENELSGDGREVQDLDITQDEDPGEEGASGLGRSSRRRELEREGEVAADFLETLLDIADLDGDIDLDIDGDRAAVAIVDSDEGRVPRRLVGPEGKVLESLQELTRLAVQSVTGQRSRLMLDVAGFRAERRAALVTIAQAAIAECRQSGADVNLEPMTAFERKVVHDEVLAAGLASQSSGVEPRRYVVISPA